MATRGAANRGGGPATFVGSVRKWELKWEESELPSYGAVASNPGSAPRRIQLLRWVRTGESLEMRGIKERERGDKKAREFDWCHQASGEDKKLNLDSPQNTEKKKKKTEERSDDGNNAAPRHPSLVLVEDASIPSWKRSDGGAAPSQAAAGAAAAAAGPSAPTAPLEAAPAPAAFAAAAAAAATNGDVTGPASSKAAETAAMPMDAEGGS